MHSEYLSAPVSFKPDRGVETPYLKAQQAWDERMGLTLAHARNWRLAFFVVALLSVTLTAGLIQLSKARKVETFVVGLDPIRGEAQLLGSTESLKYQPQAKEIRYFLTELIKLVRSVSSDPVILKSNWLKAYKFLTPEAASMLNQATAREMEDIVKKVGDKTVVVQPISVVQVPQSKSYQLRWEETIYGKRGEKTDQYIMNGIFTVTLVPPENEAELKDNPLGIFVSSFEWSRELKEK